jgi:Family of unknown function (DUF5690)
LGASLSVSFIFSAGFAKTIGGYIMLDWGTSEFWMPFVSACLFFPPLVLFLWMLNKIPSPTAEDEALRTKRKPMTRQERIKYSLTFAPGLVLLILSYTLLTAFRDFRDNFSAEIWKSLNYDKPSIFTYTESIVALVVLIVIASLMVIKNNFKAMVINHIIVFLGMVTVGLSTLAYEKEMISPPTWMILVGSVGVLLFKEFGNTQLSWLEFFMSSGYILSIAGSILITLSLIYFITKYKSWTVN